MSVVWELGECTSGDVIEAFARKRDLADSTVRNVLANLRVKGYLKPIPAIGRGFRLKATVPRETVARSSLRSLLESLFQGSPQQAIAFLLDEADTSDRELEEIRRMISARKRKEGKS
jgi:predicted transcriptional regulator